MALTGELSDLSLAELIEFFCNQRKTGRLKVIYAGGPGYFYLESGSVVHAQIGALRGVDAVYHALTLPNASFKFSAAVEPSERTVDQPWTSVVLEGLRRMDEGIEAGNPFPPGYVAERDDLDPIEEDVTDLKEKNLKPSIAAQVDDSMLISSAQLVWESESVESKKQWKLGAVVATFAMVLIAIGIPWGWYAHSQSAKAMSDPKIVEAGPSAASSAASNVKVTIEAPATSEPLASTAPEASEEAVTSSSKKIVVEVSYDENGRVTQASGSDPMALRIARQKRFPPGKAGSATIMIPIN
jgi:Domain of unknown function (DUF4388)